MAMSPLIDPDALARELGAGDLRIFDASWYLPSDGRDPDAEFERARIPGAHRFDFDSTVASRDTELPHMLPAVAPLQAHLRALGIRARDRVVFYDGAGLFASPRAWWMLRAAGHARVAVLDGGLPAWRAAGLPLASGRPGPPAHGNLRAREPGRWLADRDDVLRALDDASQCILDARPAARFIGAPPEPRPGLRRGHMAGARSLPSGDLIADGRLLPAARLRERFAEVAPDARRLICTCGSGVTAAILALAATVAGHDDVAVYDGSWAEWGRPGPLPVVTDVNGVGEG